MLRCNDKTDNLSIYSFVVLKHKIYKKLVLFNFQEFVEFFAILFPFYFFLHTLQQKTTYPLLDLFLFLTLVWKLFQEFHSKIPSNKNLHKLKLLFGTTHKLRVKIINENKNQLEVKKKKNLTIKLHNCFQLCNFFVFKELKNTSQHSLSFALSYITVFFRLVLTH